MFTDSDSCHKYPINKTVRDFLEYIKRRFSHCNDEVEVEDQGNYPHNPDHH